MDIANALFRPKSIALIGASSDGTKNAGRPQRYMVHHGFSGNIYPVNPFRDDVQGLAAYKSILDVPRPVEQAFIMTPAAQIPDILRDCATAGVTVATIYADGFAEKGTKGQALQDQIVGIAKENCIRILGPNSMGVINAHNGMTLSVNAVLEMPNLIAGRIGVVSQSGTVLGTLISRGAARGIGFSKLVSVGNESDLGVGEIVDLLVDDAETDAVLMFLEGIRDADRLAAAAARAHAKQKPIIAYKLGKSEAGRQLAVSHSGALASSGRTTNAFFARHGIIGVEMLEALFEMPPMVTGRRPRPGNRVSVVTTTGGGAAMVADRLGQQGLELVGASDQLRARLSGLGLEIGAGPLVDLTMAGTRKGVYDAALEELLQDDGCDAVVCVVGSSGQFHPELAVAPIVKAATSEKFVAAFIAPQADQSLAQLCDAGVAAFRTPEACADAVAAALAWKAPAQVALSDSILTTNNGPYNEHDALRLFERLGIPVAKSVEVTLNAGLDEIVAYPVVAKILSDEIAHKSDLGGVRVGLADRQELETALNDIRASVMTARPDVAADRFLVQSMETGLAEVLLGYRHDPEVGPIVILGSGGVLAELLDDVAIGIAPLDLKQAYDLISKVKGLALITGYRGAPKGDVAALAQAIVDISKLAVTEGAQIQEAEINPLLIKGEGLGVMALDGLVRCR